MLLPQDYLVNHFYKYKSINKFTYDCITNSELYFSLPEKLNDPFDCRPNLIYKGDVHQWGKFLLSRGAPAGDIPMLAATMAGKTLTYEDFEKTGFSFTDQGVLSLSDKCDDVLMWSHYTDAHKGLCLEFKSSFYMNSIGIMFEPGSTSFLPNGFLPVSKVRYARNGKMPTKENFLIPGKKDRMKEFILTKHFSWKYEKERRIILMKSIAPTFPFLKFSKSSLTGIIFGWKCDVKTIETIKKIANSTYGVGNVTFRQTQPVSGYYKLKLINI